MGNFLGIGDINPTPENIQKFKHLLREGNTSKVPKILKKIQKSLNINEANHNFACECHRQAIPLLHFAAAKCPTTMVMILCDAGEADVNKQATEEGFTPLMYAIIHDNADNILPLRLRKGNLNAKDNHEGNTAFHHACKEGYVECVQALFEAGADTEITNKNGKTGLDYAKWNGHQAVVNYIEEKMKINTEKGAVNNNDHNQLAAVVERIVEEKLSQAGDRSSTYANSYYQHVEPGVTKTDPRRHPSGSSSVSNSQNIGNTMRTNTAMDKGKWPNESLARSSKNLEPVEDAWSRELPEPPDTHSPANIKDFFGSADNIQRPQGEQFQNMIPKKRLSSLEVQDQKPRSVSMTSSLSNIPDEGNYDSIPFMDDNESQRGAIGVQYSQSFSQSQTKGSSVDGDGLKSQIREKYPDIKNIMKPDRVLDKLFAHCYIDPNEHDQLLRTTSNLEKNDFILKLVLKGSLQLRQFFIKILRQTGQNDLANTIMVKKATSDWTLTTLAVNSSGDPTHY